MDSGTLRSLTSGWLVALLFSGALFAAGCELVTQVDRSQISDDRGSDDGGDSMGAAAPPTFTPPAGTYATAQLVALSTTTPNATVYYTTDGTNPTAASLVYSAPIPVALSSTIRAIAAAPRFTNSTLASATYKIELASGADGGVDGGADGGADGGVDGGADGGVDGGADGGALCTTLLALQPTAYPVGANASGLAKGLFNADGLLDIVVTNRATTAKASVLLGNGAGAFGTAAPFSAATNPVAVAVADLNADTFLDLVTVSGAGPDDPGTLSVLLGNGNGTFQTFVAYPAGKGAGHVVIGDVDGDNKPDVLASNLFDDTISIRLGNGDGTFGAETTIATGAQPAGLALGKLNADAHLDVIVVNQAGNTVSVLLGVGNGTFQAKVDYATSTGPTAVAVADLDGDTFVDVVTASGNASGVSVLRGTGTGTLQAKVDLATGSGPYGVALGDVSRDGKLDIVASVAGGQGIDILRGRGDGTFLARETIATPGEFPTGLVLGDFNGDGKLDAVIVTDNNTLRVLLNACP